MYELDEVCDYEIFYKNAMTTAPQTLYMVPYFVKMFNVDKVIDIGCATGLYLKAFKMYGVDGIGVEGSNIPTQLMWVPPNYIIKRDLRFEIEEKNGYNFLMSIEVAEHIEESFADTYVTNLTKHGVDTIFMTAAPPGQGDTAHVNCQPKQYWVDKIEKKGYTNTLAYDDMIKHYAAKATEEGVFIHHWFLPNFMVFKKEN